MKTEIRHYIDNWNNPNIITWTSQIDLDKINKLKQ